jgi:hypothetical protein
MSPLLERIYKSRGLNSQIVSRKVLRTRPKELVRVMAAAQPESDEPVLRRLALRQGRLVAEGGAS